MQNYIVCLKYGSKYDAEYVNKLYSMTKRHCTVDYKFVCITEDAIGLNSNIEVLPLIIDPEISGWWYKIMLFDRNFPLMGKLLFIDLDVVILGNINKFFEHDEKSFVISRGFSKKNYLGMNSSCFRLDTGSQAHVYDDFIKDKIGITKQLHGDQDWIQRKVSKYSFWPDGWLRSYKLDGIEDDTTIAVFHGNPKPHELDITWIKENWR
jgi:hypothetical protein